ncbi:MAG: GTP 3',8-cyclase MoaA [Planctomycetota bacterium]
MSTSIDQHGSIYLRLSITDHCNLRCRYCRPAGDNRREAARLRADTRELLHLVQAIDRAAPIGKLRLTGGEPLVHSQLVPLVALLRRVLPHATLAITTNGALLKPAAEPLRSAGLDAINVSLDSLDAAVFRNLTGGDVKRTIAGLRAARRAGFTGIKLNAVLIRGVNGAALPEMVRFAVAEGCQPRFIELMPYGPGAKLFATDFVSADEALALLKDSLCCLGERDRSGTAVQHVFEVDGRPCPVGFITPVSHPFCGDCNRWRLGSDGRLRTCLRQTDGVDLLTPLRAGDMRELERRIDAALRSKQLPAVGQWPLVEMVGIGG